MRIPKEDIVKALAALGLTPKGDLNGWGITFVRDIYSFEINVNMGYFTRRPTGNLTQVKFKDLDELVKKINNFFVNLDKKEKKEIERLAKIENRKKDEKNKFQILIDNHSFSLEDEQYYYKKTPVKPRIDKDENIHFRVIISGEIRDLSIADFIKLFSFMESL